MTVPAPTAGRQHQQTRFEEGSLSPVGSASLAGVSPWGASAFNPPTPPSPSFMHSQPGGNSQQQPINSSFVTEVVKNFAMWEPSLKRYIILPPSAMIVGVKLIKQIWIGHARMLDDFQKCSVRYGFSCGRNIKVHLWKRLDKGTQSNFCLSMDNQRH